MVITANSRTLDIHTRDKLEHTRVKSHRRSINRQARQLVRSMVNTRVVNKHRSIPKEANRISQHLVIVKAKAKVKVKVSSRLVNKVSHTGKIKVTPLILVKLHRHTHSSRILRTTNHTTAHIHPSLDKISISRVSMAKGQHLAHREGNTVLLHLLMVKCLEHPDIILTKVPLERMDNMHRAATAVHMSYKAKVTMVSKVSSNKRQVVILDSMLSLNNLINQAGKRVFLMPLT